MLRVKSAKPEILYIVSAPTPWKFFGEICRRLHGQSHNFTFLFLQAAESLLDAELSEQGVPCYRIQVPGRRQVPAAIWKISRFCRRWRFDLVHTHFMDACLAGLPGSFLGGIRIRLHTRHYDTPYPYQGRRLREHVNNRFSTAIIAPCAKVRQRLVAEGVPPDRIELIPHGFDLDAFHNVSEKRIQRTAEKHGIRLGFPIIGASARFVPSKGVQHIVEAFRRVLTAYPSAQLVLANARGEFTEVRTGISRLPPGSCVEIPFEMDIFALYRLFHLFVHVPVAGHVEGFGQVYVEAMAAGIPSIFTKAGIGHELLRHDENAWIVDYAEPGQIHFALLALLSDPALRLRLARQARIDVAHEFGFHQHAARLASFYDRLLETCGESN